jgi:AAA+ ATPase superfamily predicted ATPase
MQPFQFPAHNEFLNRDADLAAMEGWWSGRDRNALALFGRRRVGKSWLFREFAHGKPAIVLVADRRTESAQLERFARQLAQSLDNVKPDLPDLPALFSVLYSLARNTKMLAIIDEFPYLLPSRAKAQDEVLTAVQAVMEERDASRLKLVLCGSHIGQMSSLLSEKSPLRGRLTPLAVRALRFKEAQAFISARTPKERIERFGVGGGMSLYLDELGSGGALRERVCSRVLDSRGPLFNDPREVLEEELRQPGVYFSILEELAYGQKARASLAPALGLPVTDLSAYLKILQDMQLIERIEPVAGTGELRYRIADSFLRFWFRFVFPFQDDLRSGAQPQAHYDSEIADLLPDHLAPVFESLCREWTRQELSISRVGSWWGNALNELRRKGERQTEEVDVVGVQRSAVTMVGEAKWTARQLTSKVLEDLETFKLPAMRQAGIKVAGKPQIALFSRSGFKDNLVEQAAARDDVRLVEVADLVDDLLR